ncbi:hypothetical protein ID866_370 [Astraeus odoratus]|nr:hypothetical protein ID866_370 [Astraeus odoratus]
MIPTVIYKASVHDHKLRWCSEGVQLGGIASAAGVVGTWTGAYHEHATSTVLEWTESFRAILALENRGRPK